MDDPFDLGRFVAAQDAIARLAHRFDPEVLGAMLDLAPLTQAFVADRAAMSAWCAELERRLNASGLGRARYRIDSDGDVPGSINNLMNHAADAADDIKQNLNDDK